MTAFTHYMFPKSELVPLKIPGVGNCELQRVEPSQQKITARLVLHEYNTNHSAVPNGSSLTTTYFSRHMVP